MLRQYINGKWVNSIYVDAGADEIDAIKSLLEGKVEEWDKKAETGKDTALPAKLNPIKVRCGRKVGNGASSCAFTLRHIETTKTSDDIKPLVIGKFASSFQDDTKAEYAELLGNKNNN